MAWRASFFVLILLLASSLWANDKKLPGGQVVSLGKLKQVEGRLEILYQGPLAGKAFRVNRTIEFRFCRPFRLWVKDSLGNLQIALNTETGSIHDPNHNRIIRVSLKSLLQNNWARFLLATLDFGALVDPKQMTKVSKTFQLQHHRGPPPPDKHDKSWKAKAPSKNKVEAGDWLILTPGKSSVYSRFLGMGRVALTIGSKLKIPTEFRYYQLDGEGFVRTVTVTIPRLVFNKPLEAHSYNLIVPNGTMSVEATDLLLALVIERLAVMWQRVKETFSRLGQKFVPRRKGEP